MEYSNSGSATVAPMPVVSNELQRLEKMQMELSEIVSALESRLAVAMREPDPSPVRSDNQKSAIAQSQLTVMIRGFANESETLCGRLSSILRRLEI